MKTLVKDHHSAAKSTLGPALSAPGAVTVGARKERSGHSIATTKNYADSRLRQFCAR